MRATRIIMGMPITIEIVGDDVSSDLENSFSYFSGVDERFSTYKDTSEISKINRNEISEDLWSSEMREVFEIAERTKDETNGYFDIKRPDGLIDPSGIVKGWAIHNVAQQLQKAGRDNFYIDAGGDIALAGKNSAGNDWSVGIRNPFKQDEIVKVMYPRLRGVATSGAYIRGQHIYNPHVPTRVLNEIVSITVVAADILEADRFATAAFAMGRDGIQFVEKMPGLEGYMIDVSGTATMTSGFEALTSL
jgi:thiamine biosynthesis lipoprotein